MSSGARPAAQLALLRNPHTAAFVLAELREHMARVEAEANGSLLVEPRLNLLRQTCHEIEQASSAGTGP